MYTPPFREWRNPLYSCGSALGGMRFSASNAAINDVLRSDMTSIERLCALELQRTIMAAQFKTGDIHLEITEFVGGRGHETQMISAKTQGS